MLRHHVVQRHGPRDTQGKRDEAEHDADVSSSGTGSSPRPCTAAHPCVTIRAQILDQFGPRVLEIVEAMTDAAPEPGEEKPPWRERKEAYVAHLAGCDDAGVHRVCLSDKIYNLRAINADFAEIGDQLWERFTAEPTKQLWYFGSLSDAFAAGRLAGTRAQQAFVAELNLMRRNVASGLPAQS